MKKNYYFVDIAKFILASFIITLHLGITIDSNNPLSVIAQYIGRLGVPFFLCASGFFVYKKNKDKNLQSRMLYCRKYENKMLFMFLIWSVIYSPLVIYYMRLSGEENIIFHYFHELVMMAPAYMWYLTAVAVAILPFCIFVYNKRTLITFFAVSSVLYCIGVCLNSWHEILNISNDLLYKKIFLTSRNGIFFAPVFISLGAIIAEIETYIVKKNVWAIFIGTVLSYFIFAIEVHYVLGNVPGDEDCSMYFSLPIIILFLFSLCIKKDNEPVKKIKSDNLLRNISTIIYCSQYGFLRIYALIFHNYDFRYWIQWILTIVSAVILYILLNKLAAKRFNTNNITQA